MKNFKLLAIGFTAGVLVMTATPALANAYKTISATLMNDVMFKIDERLAVTQGDQPVLNYNGYTYVPTRFIAENFGCEVSFDPVMRRVNIVTPVKEDRIVYVDKPVEKIVYVKEGEETGGEKVYESLPVKKQMDRYDVTMRSIVMDSEDSQGARKMQIYLNLDNGGYDRIELVPESAKLVLDKKEYEMSPREYLWDSKWNDTIKKGDDLDGYLVFDSVNGDYTSGTLSFDVRKVGDLENTKDTVTINFKK